MKKIAIYIDGSCVDLHSKDTVGGWSLVAINKTKVIDESYGKLRQGVQTSTRAELEALYQSLLWIEEYLKTNPGTKFHIYSDYEMIVHCIEGSAKRISNRDMWNQIEPLLLNMVGLISISHVKGHSKNEYNDMADKLAKKGANSLLIAPVA